MRYFINVAYSANTSMNGPEELTLLHSKRPKMYAIMAFLSAMGLKKQHENA